MDQLTKNYFYRLFFRLEIYKRSGEEFQIFFSDLMKKIDPNFVKVAAFGGDGGNDGCNQLLGRYYQIYSPKPTTSHYDSCVATLGKAKTDFDKLKNNWPDIKEYVFVFNDRFQGIPTKLIVLLNDIKQYNQLNSARCLESIEMQDYFESLNEDHKLILLDRTPLTEAPFEVDPSALGQLLRYLAHESSMDFGFLSSDAPVWDAKIIFNGIGKDLEARMKYHSRQSYRVDYFLNNIEASSSQEVASSVKAAYNESKIAIPNNIENAADMRYFWIVDRLIPPQVFAGSKPTLNHYRTVAEIVISKYFETCDIYDDPSKLDAP